MSTRTMAPAVDRDRLGTAFGMAVGLHLAMFLALPYLNRLPAEMPRRVEIELTQLLQQPETPAPQPTPPQPQSQPPQPKPRPLPKATPQPQQQALPLLAAREDTPPAAQEPVVPDIPATPSAASVTPSAPVSAPAEIAEAETAAAATISANASPATHSDEADSTEAWEGYGQLLYDMVSRNKNYPQMAIRRHWEGKVKVSARFSMGKLVELALLPPGSGYPVLDNAALEMLRKAVNALPIRGGLAGKSFTVVVPVDFKLE